MLNSIEGIKKESNAVTIMTLFTPIILTMKLEGNSQIIQLNAISQNALKIRITGIILIIIPLFIRPPIAYPTDIPISVTDMIIAQISVVFPNSDANKRGPIISIAKFAKPQKNTRKYIKILKNLDSMLTISLILSNQA